ncbi:hypothetical protein Tco_0727208 [Tanacetum coccineum]|uniref:Uncharacterized protein n=1 Tax=Tanacetum coccineum TaxID=301880 RepID=A0ABQ4YIL8_9ASTR
MEAKCQTLDKGLDGWSKLPYRAQYQSKHHHLEVFPEDEEIIKHIEIRNHFIRDSNKKKLIQMIKIYTDQNVTDLLTKAFDISRFQYLIARWLKWNVTAARDEIEVKTDNSRVNAVGHYLVLLGDKTSIENAGFAEIVDFMNVNPIRYAKMIHAKVEGKTIVISESSMRRDLQFDNEDDETVTKETEDRIERVATTASSLEVEQDNGNINKTQSMATLTKPSPQGTSSGSGPSPMTHLSQELTHMEAGRTRLKLKGFDGALTKLSDFGLLIGEQQRHLKQRRISKLRRGVKNLERKRKSKTLGMNLFKIGTSTRRSLGEEDASKQVRAVIRAAWMTCSTGDAVFNYAGTEVYTASAPVTTAGVSVSTAEPITTASVNINTAEPITPPTTITTIFEDEDLTIAQTLVKMRSEKSKVRGVVMQEPSETATRPTVPPQQHDPKDKRKEERLAREREEDANIAEWDNAQAMIDADYELAARI